MTNCNTYLALGDSYTIGEGVPLHDSYPYQAVQMIRRAGRQLYGPEIVAKTGWTTSELSSHLDHTVLNPPYSIVSLLIGVNNQYRGLTLDDYRVEFAELLHTAISLAGNAAPHVVVLSIPDWGLSPFAEGRDTATITSEIARFNAVNHNISAKAGCKYIEIKSDDNPSLFVPDGLHPSGKAYQRWANLLADDLMKCL